MRLQLLHFGDGLSGGAHLQILKGSAHRHESTKRLVESDPDVEAVPLGAAIDGLTQEDGFWDLNFEWRSRIDRLIDFDPHTFARNVLDMPLNTHFLGAAQRDIGGLVPCMPLEAPMIHVDLIGRNDEKS